MSDERRRQILSSLVEVGPDIEAVYAELVTLPWDSPAPLVTLRARHVASVLRRFLNGELDEVSVERWANAIESREDLAFDSANEESLRNIVFTLANPELSDQLTEQAAREYINTLSPP